ncbi:MAG: hypothetical protein CVU56_25780 [Deltaproteobacteria bacterium HGW-Deltaproteobacteria-14]|nr:MAG: hypothetical protein CVU56_25780 [Deltaproteobacteria bacterium HGW-Deltaproteobacteria-14]
MKFMNEAADKICKCEDMECVTKAQAELAKAGESMKDMDPSKLSADDQKAIMEATQKMGKCATDLATKAAGGAGEGEGGGEH